MTATRKGNTWVLNGTKTFCTNGHYADALVVIAVTDPRGAYARTFPRSIVDQRHQGISAREKRKQAGTTRQ